MSRPLHVLVVDGSDHLSPVARQLLQAGYRPSQHVNAAEPMGIDLTKRYWDHLSVDCGEVATK